MRRGIKDLPAHRIKSVSAMAYVRLHDRQLSSMTGARWPRQHADTHTMHELVASSANRCGELCRHAAARCWLAVCVHNTRATPPRLRACANYHTHLPEIKRRGSSSSDIRLAMQTTKPLFRGAHRTQLRSTRGQPSGVASSSGGSSDGGHRRTRFGRGEHASLGSPNYPLLRLFFRVPEMAARAARGARSAPGGRREAPRSGAGCRAAAQSAAAGG